MLPIILPANEMFDEQTQTFINTEEQTLELEHSLVSLSQWEAKWHKPFISEAEKSLEETIDYIKCMTLTPNIDESVYKTIAYNNEILTKINQYIDDPQTASIVIDRNKGKNTGEFLTSETFYYWMISLQIPFECQYWHLNRLIALIKFCSAKNAPKKKMSQREIMEQNRALNAARRKQMNSKG
jgi:hypothetical protein